MVVPYKCMVVDSDEVFCNWLQTNALQKLKSQKVKIIKISIPKNKKQKHYLSLKKEIPL